MSVKEADFEKDFKEFHLLGWLHSVVVSASALYPEGSEFWVLSSGSWVLVSHLAWVHRGPGSQ